MPSSTLKAPKTEKRVHGSSNVAAARPLDGMPPVDGGRLSLLPPYLASRINALNAGLREKGIDVIDLGMGNPVDAVAENVIDALKAALTKVENHRYSAATGIKPLREAFARHYARHYNVQLDADREVIMSIGSKDAFSHLCLAILGPRDACVLPTPAYPPHLYAPQIAGAHVVGVFMSEETPGARSCWPIPRRVFETVRPRPKFLILNFPNNPTAKTVDLGFFEEAVGLARHFKFWLLNDMAYGHSSFDGYKAPSVLLEIKGSREVAVEMFTMSKPYSMAGWRVGFLAGNAALIDALTRIKPYYDYGHFRWRFSRRRSWRLDDNDDGDRQAGDGLPEAPRRTALWTGEERLGADDQEPRHDVLLAAGPGKNSRHSRWNSVMKLAENTGVSFFPGGGFGSEGEGFVRIALVEPEARIAEACKRIGKFLKS